MDGVGSAQKFEFSYGVSMGTENRHQRVSKVTEMESEKMRSSPNKGEHYYIIKKSHNIIMLFIRAKEPSSIGRSTRVLIHQLVSPFKYCLPRTSTFKQMSYLSIDVY